jgi:hypothetical protein
MPNSIISENELQNNQICPFESFPVSVIIIILVIKKPLNLLTRVQG